MTASPVQPGDVVAGKYRVERILASGGMGVIVEALHLHLEERVAMKFLLPAVAENEEARARFLREARAAVKLRNEHVVRVADAGVADSGQTFMVMELLEGSDLDRVLQERGKLPYAEAIDYVLQACEGMADAHRLGIVHRDLKPANLFLVRRPNDTPLVKILDFGISKQSNIAEVSVTHTSAVMGSPLYMSPEQLRSSKAVDARTDMWSLGVILHECIAGSNPFAAETIAVVYSKILNEPPAPLGVPIPAELAAILSKCLAKEPADRYGSVAELARALRPFAGADGKLSADRIVRILRATLTDTGSDTEDAAQAAAAAAPVAAVSSLDAPRAPGNRTIGTFSSTGTGQSADARTRLVAITTASVFGVLGLLFVLTRGSGHDHAAASASPALPPPAVSAAPALAAPPSLPPPIDVAPTSATKQAPPPTSPSHPEPSAATRKPPPALAPSKPASNAHASVPKKPARGTFGGRD